MRPKIRDSTTAGGVAAGKKAVDAPTAGGFRGKTAGKDVTIEGDGGVVEEAVKTRSLGGVHDCRGERSDRRGPGEGGRG